MVPLTFCSGASYAMRGFRPDILDQELGVNSYNLSCSRQTMQGRHELLNLELNRNPAKTVVLELSYDSMTRNRDEEGPEGDMYMLGNSAVLCQESTFLFQLSAQKNMAVCITTTLITV